MSMTYDDLVNGTERIKKYIGNFIAIKPVDVVDLEAKLKLLDSFVGTAKNLSKAKIATNPGLKNENYKIIERLYEEFKQSVSDLKNLIRHKDSDDMLIINTWIVIKNRTQKILDLSKNFLN